MPGVSLLIWILIASSSAARRPGRWYGGENNEGWRDPDKAIPGIAGVDYPNFAEVPVTTFTCYGKPEGFYVDPEAKCQVFHICSGSMAQQSFLCPNGTIFNRNVNTCDWWNKVNCASSISDEKNGPSVSSHHKGVFNPVLDVLGSNEHNFKDSSFKNQGVTESNYLDNQNNNYGRNVFSASYKFPVTTEQTTERAYATGALNRKRTRNSKSNRLKTKDRSRSQTITPSIFTTESSLDNTYFQPDEGFIKTNEYSNMPQAEIEVTIKPRVHYTHTIKQPKHLDDSLYSLNTIVQVARDSSLLSTFTNHPECSNDKELEERIRTDSPTTTRMPFQRFVIDGVLDQYNSQQSKDGPGVIIPNQQFSQQSNFDVGVSDQVEHTNIVPSERPNTEEKPPDIYDTNIKVESKPAPTQDNINNGFNNYPQVKQKNNNLLVRVGNNIQNYNIPQTQYSEENERPTIKLSSGYSFNTADTPKHLKVSSSFSVSDQFPTAAPGYESNAATVSDENNSNTVSSVGITDDINNKQTAGYVYTPNRIVVPQLEEPLGNTFHINQQIETSVNTQNPVENDNSYHEYSNQQGNVESMHTVQTNNNFPSLFFTNQATKENQPASELFIYDNNNNNNNTKAYTGENKASDETQFNNGFIPEENFKFINRFVVTESNTFPTTENPKTNTPLPYYGSTYEIHNTKYESPNEPVKYDNPNQNYFFKDTPVNGEMQFINKFTVQQSDLNSPTPTNNALSEGVNNSLKSTAVSIDAITDTQLNHYFPGIIKDDVNTNNNFQSTTPNYIEDYETTTYQRPSLKYLPTSSTPITTPTVSSVEQKDSTLINVGHERNATNTTPPTYNVDYKINLPLLQNNVKENNYYEPSSLEGGEFRTSGDLTKSSQSFSYTEANEQQSVTPISGHYITKVIPYHNTKQYYKFPHAEKIPNYNGNNQYKENEESVTLGSPVSSSFQLTPTIGPHTENYQTEKNNVNTNIGHINRHSTQSYDHKLSPVNTPKYISTVNKQYSKLNEPIKSFTGEYTTPISINENSYPISAQIQHLSSTLKTPDAPQKQIVNSENEDNARNTLLLNSKPAFENSHLIFPAFPPASTFYSLYPNYRKSPDTNILSGTTLPFNQPSSINGQFTTHPHEIKSTSPVQVQPTSSTTTSSTAPVIVSSTEGTRIDDLLNTAFPGSTVLNRISSVEAYSSSTPSTPLDITKPALSGSTIKPASYSTQSNTNSFTGITDLLASKLPQDTSSETYPNIKESTKLNGNAQIQPRPVQSSDHRQQYTYQSQPTSSPGQQLLNLFDLFNINNLSTTTDKYTSRDSLSDIVKSIAFSFDSPEGLEQFEIARSKGLFER